MKLSEVRQERILIKTFGEADFSTQIVDIVVDKMKKVNTERFVEAICMTVICSELLNQNITFASQNYAHLNGLELAYCSKNSVEKVDMLIELDYYDAFSTGESIREKQSEPIALKSIFGWKICGYFKNPDEVNTNLNITHMYRVNANVLENYKDDIEMFQNILSNKCTEIEDCQKTDF